MFFYLRSRFIFFVNEIGKSEEKGRTKDRFSLQKSCQRGGRNGQLGGAILFSSAGRGGGFAFLGSGMTGAGYRGGYTGRG